MKKILILAFFIFVTIAIVYLVAVENQLSEETKAIHLANQAYEQAVAAEVDLTNGPCIANNLMEDWVADIAHDPREDVDNDPANQCPAYLEGTASHFIEIDPEGNIIKIR